MVTTVTSPTDSRHRAAVGQGYDGVVRVTAGSYYGTGELLFGGQAVLTAAHLFSAGTADVRVTFETATGSQTVTSSQVGVHPAYDADNGNHDLAIVWLNDHAPANADRYNLYRDGDEIGRTMTIVGYGLSGSGDTGGLDSDTASPLRLKAQNAFDAEGDALKLALGGTMAWTPAPGTQLMADFDDGSVARDALGLLANRHDLGLGQNEGLIASGDSGGPAFIDGLVAGVANYITSISYGTARPDTDAVVNSSFGEIGAWLRVGAYQQWIDQNLRAGYPEAPSQPSEVKLAVPENDSGISYAYFLVQFTGVRNDASQAVSVDFSTRDGTALAGRDYIGARGTLVLYPSENHAVIPIEILADTAPEPNEFFHLDVTNPVGGSFGEGVVQLTATRTIVDDDGYLWG